MRFDQLLACGLDKDVVARRVRKGHPDLRWPAQRLSLEIDSSPWHDGPLAQELDADRQPELEAAGERVLRTTRAQAIRGPRQLVERLAAAGAPRGARPERQRGVLH